MNNYTLCAIILGLKETATKDEIKTAYREMVMINHPDTCPDCVKNKATNQIKLIKEAYEYLIDNYENHKKGKEEEKKSNIEVEVETFNHFEEQETPDIKENVNEQENITEPEDIDDYGHTLNFKSKLFVFLISLAVFNILYFIIINL